MHAYQHTHLFCHTDEQAQVHTSTNLKVVERDRDREERRWEGKKVRDTICGTKLFLSGYVPR